MDALDKFPSNTGPGGEKSIPHSSEAEEAVIGSLLIDRDAILKVVGLLSPEDFFSPELGGIYRAICLLYQEQVPTDLLTVRNALTKLNLLGNGEGQVGVGTIFNLMNCTPSPVHIDYYAQQMREYALRRKLIGWGSKACVKAFELTDKPNESLAQLSQEYEKIAGWYNGQQQDYFLAHEQTYDVMEFDEKEKEDARATGELVLGFGWDSIDGDPWGYSAPLMLMLRSTLTGIGADTSVGKTIVASQIADYNATRGASVLFFHNELQPEHMKRRRLARMSGVPFYKLERQDMLNQQDREALATEAAKIHDWKGRVDFVHCPAWDGRRVVEELKQRQAMRIAATGRGYGLFVMDYLNRMGRARALHNGASKVEETTYNLQALGDAANELNIAGVYTYQLRREGGDGANFVKPTLHNGLDCGNIERFTNQLLGVWRDKEHPTDAQFTLLKSTFSESGRMLNFVFVPGRYEFQ
jgi:replicative DNA helicase